MNLKDLAKKLRKAAEKATGGEWVEDDGNIFDKATNDKVMPYIMKLMAKEIDQHDPNNQPSRPKPLICTTTQETVNFENNAAYLELCSPANILRILDALEKKE